MKRIDVTKNSAVISSTYKDDAIYQAWIDANIAANIWGAVGTYSVSVIDADAEFANILKNQELFKTEDLDSPNFPMVFLDDFIFQSTESGELGTTGWSFTNGTLAAQANEQNHPGIVLRSCANTNNQIASLYPASAGTSTVFRFDEFDRLTWIVSPTAVNADFDVHIGIFTSANDDTPTNGVYIQRLRTDTSWFGVSRQNNSQTRTAALSAFTANQWYRFCVRRISDTSVGFSVNNGAEVTLNTNIPAAASALTFGIQIVSGGAIRGLKLDFFSLRLLPITR
jgi:hypothetical protein